MTVNTHSPEYIAAIFERPKNALAYPRHPPMGAVGYYTARRRLWTRGFSHARGSLTRARGDHCTSVQYCTSIQYCAAWLGTDLATRTHALMTHARRRARQCLATCDVDHFGARPHARVITAYAHSAISVPTFVHRFGALVRTR